jgi:hypothetical protein
MDNVTAAWQAALLMGACPMQLRRVCKGTQQTKAVKGWEAMSPHTSAVQILEGDAHTRKLAVCNATVMGQLPRGSCQASAHSRFARPPTPHTPWSLNKAAPADWQEPFLMSRTLHLACAHESTAAGHLRGSPPFDSQPLGVPTCHAGRMRARCAVHGRTAAASHTAA